LRIFEGIMFLQIPSNYMYCRLGSHFITIHKPSGAEVVIGIGQFEARLFGLDFSEKAGAKNS
jgi:hypothetical protein